MEQNLESEKLQPKSTETETQLPGISGTSLYKFKQNKLAI